MSIFDKLNERHNIVDPDILAQAIKNVYIDADKKRAELIKAYSTNAYNGNFDKILESINFPSYQDLRDKSIEREEHRIVFRKPCG